MTEFDNRVAQDPEPQKYPLIARKVAGLLIYPIETGKLGLFPQLDILELKTKLIEQIARNFLNGSEVGRSIAFQFYTHLGLPAGLTNDPTMIRSVLMAKGCVFIIHKDQEPKLLTGLEGRSVKSIRYEKKAKQYVMLTRTEPLSSFDPMVRADSKAATVVYPYGYRPNPLTERYIRPDLTGKPRLQLTTTGR